MKNIKQGDSKKTKEQNSKGHHKLQSYFFDLVKKNNFIKEVQKIRLKHGIPLNGYAPDKRLTPQLDYLPFLPFDWFNGKVNDEIHELVIDLSKLKKKYELNQAVIHNPIDIFVVYNIVQEPQNNMIWDMCCAMDLQLEKSNKLIKNFQDRKTEMYPVALSLSPYATQNDIISFIKKYYQRHIKPAQDKYKKSEIKLGCTRRKNVSIQERNDFIYANYYLPRKQLKQLVNNKCNELGLDILDDGSLSKLISLEKQKRERQGENK